MGVCVLSVLLQAKIWFEKSAEVWVAPTNLSEEKKIVREYLRMVNLKSYRMDSRFGFIYYAYKVEVWWDMLSRWFVND